MSKKLFREQIIHVCISVMSINDLDIVAALVFGFALLLFLLVCNFLNEFLMVEWKTRAQYRLT